MAPSTIVPIPNLDSRDGHALEDLSDNIDAINVLKAELKEKDMLDKSQFNTEKDKSKFRQYEEACDRVQDFYREQHEKQTVAYNLKAWYDFKFKTRTRMSIWQAIEKLNTLIDELDPDTSLSQIEHLL